jgi:hypothetical protein
VNVACQESLFACHIFFSPGIESAHTFVTIFMDTRTKAVLVLHIVTKVTTYEVSIWVCLVVFSLRFLGNDFTGLVYVWIVSRCLF